MQSEFILWWKCCMSCVMPCEEEAASLHAPLMSTISSLNWQLTVANFACYSCSVRPEAQGCWAARWSSYFPWYANSAQALLNTSKFSVFNIQLTLTLQFIASNSLICKLLIRVSYHNVTTNFNKTEKLFSLMKYEHHINCYSGNTAFLYSTCLLSLG